MSRPRELTLRHKAVKALAQKFADWRVGATLEEKRCYNPTSRVLLSFDDIGTHEDISAILRTLRAEKVKAAFFVTNWSGFDPSIKAMFTNEGHWIGGHSITHRSFLSLTDEEALAEIEAGPATPLFRPPFGKYDARIRRLAHQAGKYICYWSIDSDDWQGVSVDYICNKVVSELRPGATVLLHLNAPHTPEALPRLIKEIRAAGLELCRPGDKLTIE